MNRLRNVMVVAGLLLAVHFSVWAQALPPDVLQRLAAAGVRSDQLFFMARPLQASGADGPSFAHNADQAVQMASLVKLLTTGAALSRWGGEHAFRTELLARRQPGSERISGPVYLRGGGDPDFQIEDLWLLLRQLRQSGVQTLDGPLVLDDTLFAHRAQAFDQEDAPGFSDDASYRAYHAQPNALLLSHGATPVGLRIRAGAVTAGFDLAPAAFRLDNRLKPKSGSCVAWKDTLQVEWQGSTLRLSGDYPVACGDQRLPVRLPDNRAWLAAWFMEIWSQLGGQWGTPVWEAGRVPDGAPLLQSWRGRELSVVVRHINKFSNNVMAQNLMLALTPAGQTAEQVLAQWLRGLGVSAKGLRVSNGSGLSRTDRMSPQLMADALEAFYTQPGFGELLVSLPKAGRDGTLSGRFADLKTSASLKTGRLKGVSALAGYLRDGKGRYWVWVSVLNGDHLEDRSQAHDILLRWFDRMLP
jgi:D-alanyl-D-alanine carboxypeptidase/D-alanyl-D-alanine-endopeptidase (penicillin-binding protein 4)